MFGLQAKIIDEFYAERHRVAQRALAVREGRPVFVDNIGSPVARALGSGMAARTRGEAPHLGLVVAAVVAMVWGLFAAIDAAVSTVSAAGRDLVRTGGRVQRGWRRFSVCVVYVGLAVPAARGVQTTAIALIAVVLAPIRVWARRLEYWTVADGRSSRTWPSGWVRGR